MRDDNTKYLLSMIAGLTSLLLVIVYWALPLAADSHRLHSLLIDCIPDAIVALIAIPTVYMLFYRRGLASMGDSQFAADQGTTGSDNMSDAQGQFMQLIPEEVINAGSEEPKPDGECDVLIVVDVQHDFLLGSLKAHDAAKIIQPLNAAIRIAESKQMLVVFTKDWHPANHWSFKENGGPWPTHCVMDTPGARLFPNLHRPSTSVVFEFGVHPGTLGYSPLENAGLDLVVSNPQVRTVYVAGIALEYCVQATCHGVRERGKKTVALEFAIAAASDNFEETEKVWSGLVAQGVVREKRVSALGDVAVT